MSCACHVSRKNRSDERGATTHTRISRVRQGLVAEYRSDEERAERAQDNDRAVVEHTQRESAQELESNRPNHPEQPQPDGQGPNVDLSGFRRGSGWRRMLVTVTGSQVRKIWNTGGRDFRPRHLCGARCSLADARYGSADASGRRKCHRRRSTHCESRSPRPGLHPEPGCDRR